VRGVVASSSAAGTIRTGVHRDTAARAWGYACVSYLEARVNYQNISSENDAIHTVYQLYSTFLCSRIPEIGSRVSCA